MTFTQGSVHGPNVAGRCRSESDLLFSCTIQQVHEFNLRLTIFVCVSEVGADVIGDVVAVVNADVVADIVADIVADVDVDVVARSINADFQNLLQILFMVMPIFRTL